MKISAQGKTMAAAATILALAACTTPEERAAQAQAQLAADKAECETLGFEPDTEGFANCLLKLREIRAQERATAAEERRDDLYGWGYPWYGPVYGRWPYPPYRYRY